MARPTSEGLSYFSLDVDMERDDKIAFIEAKYGLIAFGIIVRMFMRIYKQGYYTMWTEREQYLFAKDINVDIGTTLTIVNACINEGIFDINLYKKYQILSSRGVQRRYLKACDRRKKIQMTKEYLLITSQKEEKMPDFALTTVNADNNEVNVDINPVIDDIASTKMPQSKVNISTTTTTPYSPPKINPEENADENFAIVVEKYSNNIHPVTGEIEAEKLQDLLQRFGKVWLIAAIERAVERNKRSLGYIEGILRNWGTNGFDGGVGDGNGSNVDRGVYKARKRNTAPRKETDWDSEPDGLPPI